METTEKWLLLNTCSKFEFVGKVKMHIFQCKAKVIFGFLKEDNLLVALELGCI